MNQRPTPPPHSLDAEERAIAKALPRMHGRTAPGPDLDASILAAAQAAVRPAKSSRRPAKPRIRWIAPASLAASLLLAVGMAWHLRPLPTLEATWPSAQSDTTDVAAVRMIEPATSDKPVAAMQSVSAPARSDAPARQPAMPPAMSPASSTPEAEASPAHRARSIDAPAPPPLRVSAEPMAPAAPASPPPTPPAPPAPPPAAAMPMEAPARAGSLADSTARPSAATTGNTLDTQAVDRAGNARTLAPTSDSSRDSMERDAAAASTIKSGIPERYQQAAPKALAQPPAPAPATTSKHEARNEARMAADAGFVDDPDEDVPPATVDSPAVRDAWLNRIVELLDQGQRQDAKASLAEFRRRYPVATLPPRLRALEIEP